MMRSFLSEVTYTLRVQSKQIGSIILHNLKKFRRVLSFTVLKIMRSQQKKLDIAI